MNHLGHMIVGLLVGGIAMLVLNVFSLQLAALALLASILPDIDLKQSKASKVVEFVAVIAFTVFLQPLFSQYSIFSWLVTLLVSIGIVFMLLFPLRLKHRGITHTFKAAVFVGLLAGVFAGIAAGIVAFLAYSSHLVADRF